MAERRPENDLLSCLNKLLAMQPAICDSTNIGLAMQTGCKAIIDLLDDVNAVVALSFEGKIRIVAGWTQEGDIDINDPWTVPPEHSIALAAIKARKLVQWDVHPYSAIASQRDAKLLERMHEHAKHARAYACPLIVSNGAAIGALVVSAPDQQPIDQTKAIIATLIANLITSAIEGNKKWSKLLTKRATIAHRSVAQQIHDTLAQDAFALELLLDGLGNDPDGNQTPKSTINRARLLCSDIAKTIKGLMMEQSEGYGGSGDFMQRVHTEISIAAERSGLRFALIAPNLPIDHISPAIRDQIIFAIREGLLNAWKHATATVGFIRMAVENGMLSLVIQNDGVSSKEPDSPGMCSTHDARGFSQFGLINLREMTEDLGGSFHADVDTSSGIFTLREKFPLEGRAFEAY